jgi:hypothetical protein
MFALAFVFAILGVSARRGSYEYMSY